MDEVTINVGADMQSQIQGLLGGATEAMAGFVDEVAARIEAKLKDMGWPRARKMFNEGLKHAANELQTAAAQGPAYDPELTRRALPGYANHIGTAVVEVGEGEFYGVIAVQDKERARISEEEIGPWDMKEKLLNGPKGFKISKDGKRYKAIRFRHGWAGAAGEIGNPPMPESVYEHAAGMEEWKSESPQTATFQGSFRDLGGGRLKKVKSPSFSTTHRGETLQPWGIESDKGFRIPWKQTPGPLAEIRVHEFADREGKARRYQHTTSIYAGMQRMATYYPESGKTQRTYATFRMVGDNSPDDSWWHDGLKANPIPQVARRHSIPVIQAAMRDAAIQDIQEAAMSVAGGL